MSVLTGRKAPSFNAKAVVNGCEIVENFSIEQFLNKKYVLLIFYTKNSLQYVQMNFMHLRKDLMNLKIEMLKL